MTFTDGTGWRTRTVSRRTMLAGLGAGGLSATGLLTACTNSANTDSSGGGETGDGPWTFTDGRGETVTLDTPPSRVAAYATAGGALGYLGVMPVGVFGYLPLDETPALRGLDISGLESYGEVYGEINLEKMAAAAPELIVSCFSPKQDGTVWGFADKTQQAKAEKIAPIVALNGIKVPTAVFAGFEELVASLGVDADSAERVEQRDEFEAAVARLEEATAAKPGLVASAVSYYDGQLYVARPEAFPALRQYVQWGLQLVTPEPGEDPFWDILSLENVTKYPADLFLTDFIDDKGGVMDKSPTWNSLPAVRAGQTVAWTQLEDWAYPLYTDAVNDLADGVESAEIVT